MSAEVVQWGTLGFNNNNKNNNKNKIIDSDDEKLDDPSPRPPLPDLIPISKNTKNTKKGFSLIVNNNNNENDNLNLTLEKSEVPWPHDNSIDKNVVVTIDNVGKSQIYVNNCEDVGKNIENNDVEESIVMRELTTTTCNNNNKTDITSSTLISAADESKTDERSSSSNNNEVNSENSPAKNEKIEEQHRKSSRRRTLPIERIAFATIINEGLFSNRHRRRKTNNRAKRRNVKGGKVRVNYGRKKPTILNRNRVNNNNRKNSNNRINCNNNKNNKNSDSQIDKKKLDEVGTGDHHHPQQVGEKEVLKGSGGEGEEEEEEDEYPRVNPIFLFIKQEDTRIVEVRCEDYDKRNRIRLTKTASGWKATPRTDVSSSVVFSVLPSSNNDNNSDTKNYISNNSNNNEENNIPDEYKNHHHHHHHHHHHNINNNSKKKKKKKHKKHKKKKKRIEEEIEEESNQEIDEKEAQIIDDDDDEEEAEEEIDRLKDEDIVEQCKQTEKAIIECKPPPELIKHHQNNIWDEFDNIEAQIPSTIISVEELAKGGRIAHVREHNHRLIPIPIDELGNGDAVQKGEELHTKEKDLRAEAEVINEVDDDDDDDDDVVEKFKNVYPGSASVYENFKSESECIDNSRSVSAVEQQLQQQQTHIISSDSEENDDDDHKHMSDYNLIEGIREIQSANTEDILLHHHCGDNTMTGTELLDSLVEQHCEDNHILSGPISISDDYNDDDDVLMEPEPVADIISRLGESLSTSPKCLSFNEAGEIEGLSGDLFDTNHDHLQNPFTHDDLSITIKDLTENNAQFFTNTSNDKDKGEQGAPIVISPDSCQSEELPKDLSCHKRDDKRKPSSPLRPPSHSSDAIQSPQPSGLPAVPPSPDIFVAPKTMQKEPLDLGKCRKSASPTVSCSEEAKRLPTTTIASSSSSSCSDTDEPKAKRVKTDPENNNKSANNQNTNNASRLIEMLSSGNDPDPLTQLRLLISNTAWKVPDPLLVPKDRLNAVLASPAREIPLLLTTRPELRLPEAFAFPNILQDPDILVISLSQLETILQTQDELLKAKKQQLEKQKQANQQLSPMDILKQSMASKSGNNQTVNPLLASAGLAGDIDAATAAAFNQMLWLPYLGQMGQFAPEFLKAMMSVPNQNLQNLMPFMNATPQMNPEFCGMPTNAMDYKRQLEFAMWQEAMAQANNASLARAMKVNQEHQAKKSATTTTQKSTKAPYNNQQKNINPLNQLALSQFMTPAMANSRYYTGSTPRSQPSPSSTMSQFSPGYKSGGQQTRSNQAKTPQMQSPSKTKSPGHMQQQQQQQQQQSPMFSPNSNPFFQFPTNFQDFHEQQQVFARKSHDKQHSHQSSDDQKPRVTCKSLMNLLQPEKQQILQKQQQKLTNLMAIPGMELFTPQQQHEFQQQLYMQQHQQLLQQQQQNSNQQSASSTSTTTSHQQQHHQQHQQQHHQQHQQGKLKVKPGLHLLDPAAVQRRLLNTEEMPEVGSTTNGLEESPDLTSALWHPLFGSAQKTSYNSPWQWTTITASGE